MEIYYTTKHVTDIFNVSSETVRNWVKEFASFLSASANPDSGQVRKFTPEDMQVFALISDYKKRGYPFRDAHAALRSGQRGEVPQPSESSDEPLISQGLVIRMRDEVATLKTERDKAIEEKAFALGRVAMMKEMMKEQLTEKDQRIEELNRHIARLEAKLDESDT